MASLLSNSESEYNLLLLLQAAGGVVITFTAFSHTELLSVFCFSFVLLCINIFIIINSIVCIFSCFFKRRWEYEDLEGGNGERKKGKLHKKNSKIVKKEEKKLILRESNLLKRETELERKEQELSSTPKQNQVSSLYGKFGYCNYGHYHHGTPVS